MAFPSRKWAEGPQALVAGPWMSFVVLRLGFQVKTALLTLPTTLVLLGGLIHDFKHSLPLDIYLSILVNKAGEVCVFSLLAPYSA